VTNLEDEILIGEGVRLEAGSAPVTLRIGSGIIDAFALGVATYILVEIFIAFAFYVNEALANAMVILLIVFVYLVIPSTIETLTRGQSLVRALLGVFEVYGTLGGIAVTVAFCSRRGKRLGDYLAGTYALRTRGGTRALPPIGMPAGLEDWAGKADIRRLPDGLALTARLFLGRAHSLRPEARARLGNIIAEEMGVLVAPPPPRGTHPETFISAVLASRRDREYEFLIRQSRRSIAESEMLRRLPHGVPDVED